ncbi:MASE1 domain-containing protein, partial [Aquipuribacter hungaricus]|uniref:MASE1 domain-containing protein n=1 Tax=Aquipuribacter hungaricus TaxID=545624 RepID=UPI0030ED8E12
LPDAFTLVVLTVWAALRFDTTLVVVHDLVMGVLAVVFTLTGHGPFAVIADDATRAMVVQLYVGLIAVVGTALALGRDERVILMRRLQEHAATMVREAGHVMTLAGASRQLYAAADVRTELCRLARHVSGADLVYLLEPDTRGSLTTTATDGTEASPVTFRLQGEASLTVNAF